MGTMWPSNASTETIDQRLQQKRSSLSKSNSAATSAEEVELQLEQSTKNLQSECNQALEPIYRYIEFKGQFQVSAGSEILIMGVMLS